jgi:hypothetical protein
MLLAGLLVIGVNALAVSPLSAFEEIRMQALLSEDGAGRLFVNDSDGPWKWQACAPDRTKCMPFGGGREIATRGAQPETVFRVESAGAMGVSPEWRGRVRQLTPPTVHGVVRANEFVSPVPGSWSGGWADELSRMQLAACATPVGQDCTTLTEFHYVRNCRQSASFVLDADFVGYYLRVAERRAGVGPSFEPAYAISSPYGGEVWRQNRITAAAVVGQIAPAVNPYPGECGPPPPGEASISKEGIASARCMGGCRVVLIAKRDKRQARVVRTLPAENELSVAPPAKLQIPRRVQRRLGPGAVSVRVTIDGRVAAHRTVRFAPARG